MESRQAPGEPPENRQKRLTKERQTRFRKKRNDNNNTDKRIKVNDINEIARHELGRMDQICVHCGAKFWMGEKDRNSRLTSPTFVTCCARGKVQLPSLIEPPSYLLNLYKIGRAHV